MLDQTLKFVATNLGWIALAVSVVAIAISWQITQRPARLRSGWFGANLLAPGDMAVFSPRMTIEVERRAVRRLDFIQILIWNAGGQPVRRTDVIRDIRIGFNSGEILAARVAKESRDGNECHVEIMDAGDITFRFEYLNRDQGALIELWTTSPADPAFSCEIAGIDKGLEETEVIRFRDNRRVIRELAVNGFSLVVGSYLAMMYFPVELSMDLMWFGLGLLLFSFGVYGLFLEFRNPRAPLSIEPNYRICRRPTGARPPAAVIKG